MQCLVLCSLQTMTKTVCLVLCSLQTMTKTVMAQFVLWNVRQKCNGIKSRWNFKIHHLKNAAIQIDRNETNPQGGTGLLAVPPPESLEPLTWVTTANTNETTQTDTGNLHIQSSADWFCDLRVGQTCQKGGNIDKRHTAWVHSTSLVDVTTFLTSLQRDTGCLHCKGRQTVHCKGTQAAYTAKGDRLYTAKGDRLPTLQRETDCTLQRETDCTLQRETEYTLQAMSTFSPSVRFLSEMLQQATHQKKWYTFK